MLFYIFNAGLYNIGTWHCNKLFYSSFVKVAHFDVAQVLEYSDN